MKAQLNKKKHQPRRRVRESKKRSYWLWNGELLPSDSPALHDEEQTDNSRSTNNNHRTVLCPQCNVASYCSTECLQAHQLYHTRSQECTALREVYRHAAHRRPEELLFATLVLQIMLRCYAEGYGATYEQNSPPQRLLKQCRHQEMKRDKQTTGTVSSVSEPSPATPTSTAEVKVTSLQSSTILRMPSNCTPFGFGTEQRS